MSADIKKRRPRKRRWRRFKERDGTPRRGTYIVPNLFTTANLFSGFFGIVNAINGKFEMAAIAILISCVFDILDGKVARLTKATSRFGLEYDSLADLVAFGVGPGLLVYLWALRPFGRLGWLAAFVFMACGALRLARFNVQVGTVSSKYFVGLPIPGGATMIATTVLFFEGWEISSPHLLGVPLLVFTYILGFLMVSTIPYNSFKDFEFVKSKPLPVLFLVIVLVTVVAVSPGPMMFTILLTYIIAGPLEYLLKRYRTVVSAKETDTAGPIRLEQPRQDDVTQP
jgi:CDP-diacylglycerol---serine O-phosphatidyltransferase